MIAEIFSDDVPLTWKQRSEVEYVAERFGCTRTLQTVPREALRGIIAWTRGKIQCVFHAFFVIQSGKKAVLMTLKAPRASTL